MAWGFEFGLPLAQKMAGGSLEGAAFSVSSPGGPMQGCGFRGMGCLVGLRRASNFDWLWTLPLFD